MKGVAAGNFLQAKVKSTGRHGYLKAADIIGDQLGRAPRFPEQAQSNVLGQNITARLPGPAIDREHAQPKHAADVSYSGFVERNGSQIASRPLKRICHVENLKAFAGPHPKQTLRGIGVNPT